MSSFENSPFYGGSNIPVLAVLSFRIGLCASNLEWHILRSGKKKRLEMPHSITGKSSGLLWNARFPPPFFNDRDESDNTRIALGLRLFGW